MKNPVYLIQLFLLMCLFYSSVLGQDLVVNGIVIDSKSREPLGGANVFIPQSAIGTTTDTDGYFKLIIPEQLSADTLVISYLGYRESRNFIPDIRRQRVFALQSLILDSEKAITVYGDKLDLARKELPHAAYVVKVDQIERYGTSEIGDLFKLDPAIRIEGNDIDGRFIQIRGSDPNEVNVYIDGVLLNTLAYNNAADLSAIATENIEKLEILSVGTSNDIERTVRIQYNMVKDTNVLNFSVASRGPINITDDTMIDQGIYSDWQHPELVSPYTLADVSTINGDINTVLSESDFADDGYTLEEKVQGAYDNINYDVPLIDLPSTSDFDTSPYAKEVKVIPLEQNIFLIKY